MAERDTDVDVDIDGMLGSAAADTRRWSAQPPVPVEMLEGRAARRRTARLASAGAAALAVVVIAAVVTARGGFDRGTEIAAISPAAEPPPTVRTATPENVHSAAAGGTVRVEGLPTEGVAVEDGDSVRLLSIDGAVLQRLDGFRLQERLRPGELLLDGPDGTVYELDALAGVLAPRPPGTGPRTSLSYGAVFVPTSAAGPSGVVQRDGETLFSIAPGDGVHVSWDRDIVTRVSDGTSYVAFDLRTASARRLPKGCRVADRHGPAWFLECSDTKDNVTITRLDADGSTKTLAEFKGGKSFVDAMVSPDGRELVVYGCSGASLRLGTTSAGDLRKDAGIDALSPEPLGWSVHGELVVVANSSCGSMPSGKHGVFAFDGEELRTITEAPGKAAMWMPVLEHR